MSYDRSPFALTPWVRRLMMVTGAVYLLQVTVFVGPWLKETFGFSPLETLSRPWAFLTYAFVHGSFLHLFGNMLGLFMFGPPVEGRLGSRTFIRLYLLSALGGPLLSLALLPLAGDGIIIGASAAVFGVMLAFVLEWPDAPVMIFPFPVPVKAKWLVLFLATLSLLSGINGWNPGVAHFAHLGGFAAAFLYLRGSTLLTRPRAARTQDREPLVLVPPSREVVRRAAEKAPPPLRRSSEPSVNKAELDRVLDKISERGPHSLTADERRFLDEMSKRFRQDH